jgi:hypothetical protein
MATKYSFIGQYQKAIEAYDLSGDKGQGDFLELFTENCAVVDAKKYIVERSKREKVIIINEAHHQPLHRVFTTSLLNDLWKNGYRYFGLEGIADGALINQRKKVKLSDGFYTSEPQFANMVRHAIKVGFTLFAYEAAGKNGVQREQAQALNIAKVMRLHPNGKFLIHCGFSHVVEDNHPDWGKAMAGRLKTLSGYDPFTIDQVEMSERSQKKIESTAFKQLQVKQPSVVIKNDTCLCNISNDIRKIDIKVVHPSTKYAYNRPTWLLINKNYKYVNASAYFSNLTFPALIFAYDKTDDDTHVPIDVIEIERPNNLTQLVLPVGTYRLKMVNEKNKSIIKEVVVK